MIGCCVVVMASSCWINPIAQGTGAVTKSETMQTIRDIVKSDPSAIWLTVDLEYPGTNIPAMAGADCFNTTQTYPQKERWTMLDESVNTKISIIVTVISERHLEVRLHLNCSTRIM